MDVSAHIANNGDVGGNAEVFCSCLSLELLRLAPRRNLDATLLMGSSPQELSRDASVAAVGLRLQHP